MPIDLAVTGKFFASAMTVALALEGRPIDSKSFTQQFKSSTEWDFTVTVPSGTSKITALFTLTSKNLVRDIDCSAKPVKKIVKPKGEKKSVPPPSAVPPTPKPPKKS